MLLNRYIGRVKLNQNNQILEFIDNEGYLRKLKTSIVVSVLNDYIFYFDNLPQSKIKLLYQFKVSQENKIDVSEIHILRLRSKVSIVIGCQILNSYKLYNLHKFLSKNNIPGLNKWKINKSQLVFMWLNIL